MRLKRSRFRAWAASVAVLASFTSSRALSRYSGAPGFAGFIEDGVGEDVVVEKVDGNRSGPRELGAGAESEVEILQQKL
jgi:hypothetical protein